MMCGVAKSRVKGFEAYARVLLDGYTPEKFWFGDECLLRRCCSRLEIGY